MTANECNETAKFINAKTQEQQLKSQDEEIAKLFKMRIIMKELRKLKPENEQVRRALKLMTIVDYLHLGDNNDEFTLDLRECYQSINLSYTERKILREELIKSLSNTLRPIVALSEKFRAEFPYLFDLTKTSTVSSTSTEPEQTQSTVALSPNQKLIIELEKQRRQKIEKLAQLQNRKCEYLKRVAELKLGPYLANELEQLNAQARMSQIKTNLLRGYFTNEIVTRTEHSLKAHKEVEGYMDEMLAKLESDGD